MYSFTLSFFLSILLDILQYRLFKILSSLFFASSDNSLYRYHFIFEGSFVVILIILFRPASVSFPVFCTAMLASAQSSGVLFSITVTIHFSHVTLFSILLMYIRIGRFSVSVSCFWMIYSK